MKKTMTFFLMTFLVVLTGCAPRADNIKASYVLPSAYENHDCDQLVSEAVYVNGRLAEIYDSLRGKANSSAYTARSGNSRGYFSGLVVFL